MADTVIDRPIIVIGAPRSGTTILRNTLVLHPDLWHLPAESHDVLEGPCHPRRCGFSSNRVTSVDGDVAAALRAGFASRALNVSATVPSPRRVLGARTQAERVYAKAAVRLAAARSRPGRPDRIRFVEKTPKNSLRVPLMAQLFPDAFWVFVTRRAEPNISSLVEGWHAVEGVGPFTRPRFASSAYPIAGMLELSDYHDQWWKFALPPDWEHLRGSSVVDVAAWQYQQCNRFALDDLHALDRPVRHIHHEDFVADPVTTIRALFEWAELAPSPVAEEFAASLPKVNATRKGPGQEARRAKVRTAIDHAPEIAALERELGYVARREIGTERASDEPPSGGKVLYVAGYGRSGSTALAAVLSGHPEVVGVGELTFLADDWDDPERRCSCGARYPDCQFWGGLLLEPDQLERNRRVIRDVDRHIRRTWRGPARTDALEASEYRKFHQRVLDYARRQSGSAIVLDSSKSARGAGARAIALRRFVDADVYLVHLVRDGMACVDSMVSNGSNWVIEGHGRARRFPAARASVGWVRANLCALAARAVLGPDRVMQLSYDDLLRDPDAALARIGDLVGVDYSSVATGIQRHHPFAVGHVVGGNRIRMEGSVELWSSDATRPRLGPGARLTFFALGGWLRWALARADGQRLPIGPAKTTSGDGPPPSGVAPASRHLGRLSRDTTSDDTPRPARFRAS